MLRKLGILIKKKKVQRRTSSYKVYTQIKKYYSYKGTVGKVAPMENFFGILKQEL